MARQPRRPAQRPRRDSVRQEPRGPARAFELEDVEALRQSLQATMKATRRRLPSAEQLQDAVSRALLPEPGAMGAWQLAMESLKPVTSMPDTEPPLAFVDDEYSFIARRLSDNDRDVLKFLSDHQAIDRASRYVKSDMADELGLTLGQVRVVCRNVTAKKLGVDLLENQHGNGGGIWLSPTGIAVAERIPPQTCRHFTPQSKPKRHSNGTW